MQVSLSIIRELRLKRACQRGAGPAEQTASGLGICTCCSSSQSPVPAAQQSDHRHADVSRSQRFSSPVGHNAKVLLTYRQRGSS